MIYSVEKTLRDAGDKVSADVKKGAEEKIEAVKKTKDGSDEVVLKKALDELQQEIQKIGAEMYQQEKGSDRRAGN